MIALIFTILNLNIGFWNTHTVLPQDKYENFPKSNNSVYVIAHRGAHIDIPENTLAAYRRAIDLGCDFIEVDIRRTKDGRFVSIHNSTVDAYTNEASGKVSNFLLSELKQLDIGSRIDSIWSNERIPTFEEILQLCKGKIGIYLDLKEPYVKELVNIIKTYKMENDIVWYIPFSEKESIEELLRECKKCFLMPDPDIDEIDDSFMDYSPIVIAPVMSQFSQKYVLNAKKLGVKVFVDEKIGNEDEWEKILNYGADGIQTDNPERLINFLRRR